MARVPANRVTVLSKAKNSRSALKNPGRAGSRTGEDTSSSRLSRGRAAGRQEGLEGEPVPPLLPIPPFRFVRSRSSASSSSDTRYFAALSFYQQHRNFETESSFECRIGRDIHDFDG